jgi:hypothetical protein
MLTGNQDNLCYHEILREPDKNEFIKAMKEEIANHNDNNPNTSIRIADWYQGNSLRLGHAS